MASRILPHRLPESDASRSTRQLPDLPIRSAYDGVSCRPTTVAAPSQGASPTLSLLCRMDQAMDAGQARFRNALWRSVGLANKICAATGLPRIHRRIPRVQRWRSPTPIVEPIFIVGSPRSGTTVLGKVLGHQGEVLFLSEARPIWFEAVPELDESGFHWNGDHLVGRIYMDESDVTPESKASLEQSFGNMMTLAGRNRLLEKMPLNLFRVRWLDALWPDARFVQILRDPFSTTSSKTQNWPSIDERELPGVAVRRRMFARLRPELADLLDTVRTPYEWYLFEWRMYTEEGERLAKRLARRYYFIRLEDAQRNPEAVLEGACRFTGLGYSARLRRAYRTWLDPRVRLAHPEIDPSRCAEILGDAPGRWGYAL